MAGPKKHHYVPQSILRRFSIKNEGRQVHVFDKASARTYAAAIVNAGSENHFYSVEVGDQRFVLEHLFDDIDREGATLLDKICQARSLCVLSKDERILLGAVAATQLLRVKWMRNEMIEVSRQMLGLLEKHGGISAQEIDNHVLSDRQARIASIERLADLPLFADFFLRKDLILISSGQKLFFIGDNPIVLYNSFPYGELGLSSPGVEIYFPISRDLVVGFYCRSIRDYLERFEDWGDTRFQLLLDSIQSGDSVEFSASQVDSLNQLQVHRSTRYLYSPEPDFSLATAMLDHDPDLAQGKAMIQIGWEGYTHREAMPMGTFVVAVGQVSHYMIPAEVIDDGSDDCEWAFRTPAPEMVRAAINDSPFKEVTLFIDKRMRRQTRDVIFLIKENDAICVRVRDEALHRLFRTIDNEKRAGAGGQIEESGDIALEIEASSREPVRRLSHESLQEFVALGRQLVEDGRIPESQLEELQEMEEHLREATPEEWENYNYFVENFPSDASDITSLVSSGDLLVQEKVHAFIRARLPNPSALESADFTVDHCIALGEALCGSAPEPARLWRRIRKLHSMVGIEDEAVAGLEEEFLSEFENDNNITDPGERLGRAIFMVYHEICWLISLTREQNNELAGGPATLHQEG